jgi:hypothetical protein
MALPNRNTDAILLVARFLIAFIFIPGGFEKLTSLDAGAARRFSDQLLEAPRSFADRTSISGAIDFAATLFDRAPYDSTRRIIDVSEDGTNNSGRDVGAARDDAVAEGITITG